MRDTRKQRAILIVAITSAIGAVIGDYVVKPYVEKAVKK